MRVRIAFAAVAASLSLGLVAVPAAEASNGTTVPPKITSLSALKTIQVTGTAKNQKVFTGTFGIQRFVVRNGQAYALGTLTGRLKGRHVTRYGVMMPASLAALGKGPARDAQATSCEILHLVLGPIDLNLLGLRIKLGGGPNADQQIVLDISGTPGNGNLLGNLLCDLSNALNQPGILTALNNDLQQLESTLNGILGIISGIPGITGL